MQVSQLITAADSNFSDSLTTPSIAPTANRALIAVVCQNKQSGGAVAPVMGGTLAVTWTQVASRTFDFGNQRLTLFRANSGAAPGSGTVEAAWSGVTFNGATIWIGEGDADVDPVSPFVQAASNISNTTNVTTLSATLAAFADAGHGVFACAGFHTNPGTVSAGSGFSLVGGLTTANGAYQHRERRVDNDTSVDFSWTTAVKCAVIAVELRLATATPLTQNVSGSVGISGAVTPTLAGGGNFSQNVAGSLTPAGDLVDIAVGLNDGGMEGFVTPIGEVLATLIGLAAELDGEVNISGQVQTMAMLTLAGNVTPGGTLKVANLLQSVSGSVGIAGSVASLVIGGPQITGDGENAAVGVITTIGNIS